MKKLASLVLVPVVSTAVGTFVAPLAAVAAPNPFLKAFHCEGDAGAGPYNNVVVPEGAACTMTNTVVNGDVVVLEGAKLHTDAATIFGNLKVNGASALFIDDGTYVGQNAVLTDLRAGHERGDDGWGDRDGRRHGNQPNPPATVPFSICNGTNIEGNLVITNAERGDVGIGDPTCPGGVDVYGNTRISDNESKVLEGQSGGNGSITANENRYVSFTNDGFVGNFRAFDNHFLQVSDSLFYGTMTCRYNDTVTGGSNTAAAKYGQCAAL